MKLPFKPECPFVLVEWDDAWKASVSDTTIENAGDDHHPIKCFMMGMLLRDDEEGVQLACEYSPDDKHFRQRSFVPRPMVKNVYQVRLTLIKPKTPPVEPSDPVV